MKYFQLLHYFHSFGFSETLPIYLISLHLKINHLPQDYFSACSWVLPFCWWYRSPWNLCHISPLSALPLCSHHPWRSNGKSDFGYYSPWKGIRCVWRRTYRRRAPFGCGFCRTNCQHPSHSESAPISNAMISTQFMGDCQSFVRPFGPPTSSNSSSVLAHIYPFILIYLQILNWVKKINSYYERGYRTKVYALWK